MSSLIKAGSNISNKSRKLASDICPDGSLCESIGWVMVTVWIVSTMWLSLSQL
jgi:hypothetical protein